MSTSTGFPRSLLQRANVERLAYFEAYTVAHPRLIEVDEALMRAIREPAGAALIFVYGPTGVGKTTLRLRVEKRLICEALPNLETNCGRIPVVGIEAVAPESGNFSWKDYYTRALAACEEPLIEHKIDYGVRGIHCNSEGQLVIEPRVVAPALRRALEQALSHRRPDVFFIDEAQHLEKMASGRKLQDNMDCLKSLAQMTGIVHGLLGTYELLMFRNLSAQLSRRSVDIHFRRYRADCKEDLEAFMSVVLTFQRHLPLFEEPDLLTDWEYCYERTLGCVGVLKNWLTRALRDALEEGATTVSLKHLEQRAWSVSQCQNMLKEISEGEKQLTETKQERDKLRAALGLGVEPTQLGNSLSEIANSLPVEAPKSQLRRGDVGRRKAKRDQVGVKQHGD